MNILFSTIELFCIGETTAIALFRLFRGYAKEPIAHSTLTTILADEVRHSQFGWTVLAEIIQLVSSAQRQELMSYADRILTELSNFHNTDFVPTQQEQRWGLCSGSEQARIVQQTVPDLRKKLHRIIFEAA